MSPALLPEVSGILKVVWVPVSGGSSQKWCRQYLPQKRKTACFYNTTIHTTATIYHTSTITKLCVRPLTLTEFSSKALQTATLNCIFFVHTGRTIQTRCGGTVIDVHCTVGPSETRFAYTGHTVPFVSAGCSIWTHDWIFAKINIVFAMASLVANPTVTAVTIYFINTESTILTRIGETLIQVKCTFYATISRLAMAFVSIDLIYTGSMLAWVWFAFIDVDFTNWTWDQSKRGNGWLDSWEEGASQHQTTRIHTAFTTWKLPCWGADNNRYAACTVPCVEQWFFWYTNQISAIFVCVVVWVTSKPTLYL